MAVWVVSTAALAQEDVKNVKTKEKKEREEKVHYAVRATTPPKIDGMVDEEVWQDAPIATGFIQRAPDPGKPADQKTEVRILYDNTAIYVAAVMYETNKDGVMKEVTRRDEWGFTDEFSVMFDTYNDDQNAFEFRVTAAGVQIDQRITLSSRADRAWNAGYWSAVKIFDDRWEAEMEIPLSALRFPNKDIQEWGVNFMRSIRRINEESYWMHIDPQVEGMVNQYGLLKGIENVESPLRLSVSPYVTAYYNSQPVTRADGSTGMSNGYSLTGGMDLRYGLNQAYTLDMMLVPDFGQVISDQDVLNLTPFEVFFAENRQFFTEGSEIFNKSGLFYSRRIGSRPMHFNRPYSEKGDHEVVIANQQEAPLLNATKISGRNNKGLGIGLLNALARPTFATLRDTLHDVGSTREVQTGALTNYNVLSIDQNLKNNSYFNFVNNSVIRKGDDYSANLTGANLRLNSKGNIYFFEAFGALSQQYGIGDQGEDQFGYNTYFAAGKSSGTWQYSLGNWIESDTYDPNDIGFLRANNENGTRAAISYNIFEPFGKFLRSSTNLFINYRRLYNPNEFTNANIHLRSFLRSIYFISGNLWVSYSPVEGRDYFEPRVAGRYFVTPSNFGFGGNFSTDYRKRFAFDIDWEYFDHNFRDRDFKRIRFRPRFRISDNLSFSGNFTYDTMTDDVGYVSRESDNRIFFGVRDRRVLDNVLTGKYTFSNRIDLFFRARHYWSAADYTDFFLLGDDGLPVETSYQGQHDVNLNLFNIDMILTWNFAPASEISVVWKNAIVSQEDEVIDSYFRNVGDVLASPQNNSFSIRVLYFIDYLMLKKSALRRQAATDA